MIPAVLFGVGLALCVSWAYWKLQNWMLYSGLGCIIVAVVLYTLALTGVLRG